MNELRQAILSFSTFCFACHVTDHGQITTVHVICQRPWQIAFPHFLFCPWDKQFYRICIIFIGFRYVQVLVSKIEDADLQCSKLFAECYLPWQITWRENPPEWRVNPSWFTRHTSGYFKNPRREKERKRKEKKEILKNGCNHSSCVPLGYNMCTWILYACMRLQNLPLSFPFMLWEVSGANKI